MEMILGNGFCEMSKEDLMEADGGGWLKAGAAFLGGVLFGSTPVAACYGVGTITFTTGCALLDYACK